MRLAALIALVGAGAGAVATAATPGIPGQGTQGTPRSLDIARRVLPYRRQATTVSTPRNTTGCEQHGDHWHCANPEQENDVVTTTIGASNSTAHADEDHDHDHETDGADAATDAEKEAAGCVRHLDHWDCPSNATSSGSASASSGSTQPETDEEKIAAGCEKHEDHWHCPEDASGSESSASSDAESGECIIHIGHTHGDCSQEQKCSGTLGAYNMPLHIGSVFIVLVGSALGVALPLVAKHMRAESSQKEGVIFFIARHFGTGIIMATAFIHLLYHGFVMFASECLDGLLAFDATSPALAMAAAFITFLFDMAGARMSDQGGHSSADHVHGVVGGGGEAALTPAAPIERDSHSTSSDGDAEKGQAALAGYTHDHAAGHAQPMNVPMCTHNAGHTTEEGWQVIMLEAGIIFHSIMIGVTLGAGSGAGWTTLLIVIVFHQFFEGAALGARIALLCVTRLRSFIMGLAFALITPVGIGIGIGVRHALAEHPRDAMIAVGVLNSLSAGILLYTAFKLLSVDFVDGALRRAPVPRILGALASMLVGMAAMSVLGKWA